MMKFIFILQFFAIQYKLDEAGTIPTETTQTDYLFIWYKQTVIRYVLSND